MSPIVENFKKSNPASSEFRKYIRTQAVMNQIDRLIEAGNDLRAEALILRNIRDPKVREKMSTMCKLMEPVAAPVKLVPAEAIEQPAPETTEETPVEEPVVEEVAEETIEEPVVEVPVTEEVADDEPVAGETIEVAEPTPKKRGRKTTKTEE